LDHRLKPFPARRGRRKSPSRIPLLLC
jgi:hypothetical protein